MQRLITILLLILPTLARTQIITTVAGTGAGGYGGDGGPATAAIIMEPSRLAFDAIGNLLLATQTGNRIRKINTSGIITTIAGIGGLGGYGGDGGPATNATLYWPEGIGVDNTGNIYIADQFNNRVRKIDTNGIINTIAGSGSIGFSGDGGPATDAALWHPSSVAIDGYGAVFFTDQDNNRVRKIATTGIITTIAGTVGAGFGGDGGPASAAQLNFPEALTVDAHNNIYVADLYNQRIRKIDTNGIINTIAGGGTTGLGDGGPATAAFIYDASAVCVDKYGNVFIGDLYHNTIRKVDTLGIITTIAGNDTFGYRGDCGPATVAELSYIQGLATDSAGSVFISDFNNNRVREVSIKPDCNLSAAEAVPLPSPFRIYPNPSTGIFQIDLPDNDSTTVLIYNTIGALVLETKLLKPNNTIDLSAYPLGIYFLHIHSVNSNKVEKIIRGF